MEKRSTRTIHPEHIRLIVTDVDGIWTDGSLFMDDSGREMKCFSAYDGLAVKLARTAGIRVAILSSRNCGAVSHRCRQLGIHAEIQGSTDKIEDLHGLCDRFGTPLSQVLYMGDDLPDLPPLQAAGIAVTVPDAATEVRAAADLVTAARGGHGAIREMVEWLLKSRRQWESIITPWLNPVDDALPLTPPSGDERV